MAKVYHIKSPFSEPLDFLEVGDIVYLTGLVITARDQAHRKVVLDNVRPPIDLKNLAIWHAGPVVLRRGNEWVIVSIGSTTSTRMEHIEAEFIKRTGVKIIIGKGFMGEKTANACKKYGCVVALYPGGLGALGAKAVKKVLAVYWLEELGVPEALWVLE
ncbi:MAG: FumA C-terminus/TtdB family hydratase beta subunit, partial [Ignisphaera sp.]